MTRPPIVGAELWRQVMDAAGDRCECRGACGKTHDPNRRGKQHRCARENGQYITGEGRLTLIATPRDPINEGSFAVAAQLPARRLAAMCPKCHNAVRLKIQKAERQLPPQDDGLFGAEEYRATPVKQEQAKVGRA